jgi:hypothetical protein
MICEKCETRFSANWLSPSPGGYSPPGCFFFINILLLGLCLICLIMHWWVVSGIVAFAMLVCLGANFTSWQDSNKHRGEKGQAVPGLNCPKCGHVHTVYPWSL